MYTLSLGVIYKVKQRYTACPIGAASQIHRQHNEIIHTVLRMVRGIETTNTDL
jgi:hypothetical protein